MGDSVIGARSVKLRLLSLAEVRAASVDEQAALHLIRAAYEAESKGLVEVPLKQGTSGTRPHSFLDAMPAKVGEALGMKWVSYFPGNMTQGLSDSSGLIVLNHPEHGQPVCIMEGMHITFLRTAACAAVLAQQVMSGQPETLGLVGCGGLGKWSARMLKAAFPSLRRVLVSSRTSASRQRFCESLSQQADWELVPVDDVQAAVSQSDIVVSSLPPDSGRPLKAAHFKPGAVFIPLDLVHAWQDDVLLQASDLMTDSVEYLRRLLQKHRPEVAHAIDQRQTVEQDVASGPAVVAVCGIASTDVILAWEVYRRACRAGLGVEFDICAEEPGMSISMSVIEADEGARI